MQMLLCETGHSHSTGIRSLFKACFFVQWSSPRLNSLIYFSDTKHLHGVVPELGKGNEASMFFVDGSGRTSGHEVCVFAICWDRKLVLFPAVVLDEMNLENNINKDLQKVIDREQR
jgi:hypothetical protein